jgi:hypothetical protein
VEIHLAPGQPAPDFCPVSDFRGAHIVCMPATDPPPPVVDAYAVTLAQGDTVLWQGTMRVAAENGDAQVSQSHTEILPCHGTPARPQAAQRVESAFTLRLQAMGADKRIAVSAKVTTPYTARDAREPMCLPANIGGHSSALEDLVDPPLRDPVTLHGEDNLSVTIAPQP